MSAMMQHDDLGQARGMAYSLADISPATLRSPRPMYAIVKTGGKQYRVAEGDVIEVDKLASAPGEAVTLPAVLIVDGGTVLTDPARLAEVAVSAEVVAHTKGPKIRIHKFKNKTGYHKRQGHRQPLTQVKVTQISTGK
jgi:large subunit ribosomal protein L21